MYKLPPFTVNRPVKRPLEIKKGFSGPYVPRQADLERPPEVDQAEYEIICDHLLEVMRTAQAERRNVAIIRGTTFFATLGIPAAMYTLFSQEISNIGSATVSLGADFALSATSMWFVHVGQKLNDGFEYAMAEGTYASDEAERLIREFQKSGGLNTNLYRDADYAEIRRKARNEIREQVKTKKFGYDVPTQAVRTTLYIAAFAIAANLILKIGQKSPHAYDELKSEITLFSESVSKKPVGPVLKPEIAR